MTEELVPLNWHHGNQAAAEEHGRCGVGWQQYPLQAGTSLCPWCWLALTLPWTVLLWQDEVDVWDPAGDAPLYRVWEGLTTGLLCWRVHHESFSWMFHYFSVEEDCPYHFITGTSTPLSFQWWILRTNIPPKLCALRSTGLSTQSWDPTHPVKHLTAWPHGILTAKSRSDSCLGTHSASTNCFKPERISLPALGRSRALPLPAQRSLPGNQDLLGLRARSYRCWAPYGMHRAASSHTPPKKSAVLNFYFSKKNTAGIRD